MRAKRELTIEQQDTAIDMACKGDSISQIANKLDMHPMQLARYRKRHPSFEMLLTQAREIAIEDLVASTTNLVDQYENPNAARAKFDAIKWRAAVTDPAKYGDRLNLDVHQTIDLTSILSAAKNRLSPLLDVVTELDERTVTELPDNGFEAELVESSAQTVATSKTDISALE